MTRFGWMFRATAYAGLVGLPLIAAGSLPAGAQQPPPPQCMGGPDMGGCDMGPGKGGPGPHEMMHGGPGEEHGPEGMHGGGPLAELARAEADQVAAQAVANLAKAPLADVQRMIRAWGVPTVLRYYDVPPKAFHDAAAPGLVALVRSAEQQNQISSAEAERIVDHVQHEGPHGMGPQ